MSGKEVTIKVEEDEDNQPVLHPPTNTYGTRTPRNRYFCAVFACMNSSDNDMNFFELPTDAER